MEQCIRLEGQVISGDVGNTTCYRGFDIISRLFQRLMRQGIHQIEIHIVEILPGNFYRPMSFPAIMYPAQRLKVPGVEALDTDG